MDEERLDLLIRTNGEISQRGDTIFHEQVVWITSNKHLVHEKDPVPLAVYHEDCIFREWGMKSLEGIGRRYRIAYTSPGSAGIFAAVKAGLAVAPVALSTVTGDMRILGPADGFPLLPSAVITLIKVHTPPSPVVQTLAEYITECFRNLSPSD